MNIESTDRELEDLMEAMKSDDAGALQRVDRLIARYGEDGRLHFLRGSILASIGRPIEALPALKTAVELAPDLAIARFQLGFFQLTSGEAAAALESWGPLALLPDDNYLRKFVAGLTYLIRDEFAQALALLREGIAGNDENPPLNRDIQLIVNQVSELQASAGAPGDSGGRDEDASPTSFLLDQFGDRGRAN